MHVLDPAGLAEATGVVTMMMQTPWHNHMAPFFSRRRTRPLDPGSFLFITLDSCRFDTFAAATIPNFRALGAMQRAWAPGYFTCASHAAMFQGFTPGDGARPAPYINPKFCKIFKMESGLAFGGIDGPQPHVVLQGRNVIDGFKRRGYRTIGTGAVGWFNPELDTSRLLVEDFDEFYYSGIIWSLRSQLDWLNERLDAHDERPVLAFLNVGETHVPYYYDGAPLVAGLEPVHTVRGRRQ